MKGKGKGFDRKLIIACLIVFIAAIGVVSVAMEYRAGSGFHPFQTDRELQNRQVLFPDGAVGSKVGEDKSDTDSFWKKDNTGEKNSSGGSGNGSGYLLDQTQKSLSGDSSEGAVLQGGAGSVDGAGGTSGGNIYGIVDGSGDAGTVMPGDIHVIGDIDLGDISDTGDITNAGKHDQLNGGSETPSGGNSNAGSDIPNNSQGSNNNENANNTTNGGSSSGGDSSGGGSGSQEQPEPVTPPDEDEEKGPGSDLTTDPVPGNGSSSRDDVSSDVAPPPSIDDENSSSFDSADPEKLKQHDCEIVLRQPENINGSDIEALYKGQKDVDALTVFRSIEAYIWDNTDKRGYYWTPDDLVTGGGDAGKHIKITGVSFDGGITIEKLPIASIPDDASDAVIYVSYRIDANDGWTEYAASDAPGASGVKYKLMNSRVIILKKIIETVGEVIKKENILNADSQYINDETYNSILNLFEYQGALLGADNTGRMKGLFPGWKEDGFLVPFLYSLDKVGRHVLEPSALVKIDTDKYQINLRSHWMNKNYEITESGGTSDTIYVSLQALDDYVGEDKHKMDDTHPYDWIEALDVPEYVQSVEFDYCLGFCVGDINIPDTVLYVNTNGIPTILDTWLMYDRGIQVDNSYTVSEGNPRYASENGLLYNKEKTEILGVPAKRTELTVDSGIKKVVLPYQNQLAELKLDIDSVDELPDINYERLNNKTCRITVPDSLLMEYISKQSNMLQRTGLYVGSDADTTRAYHIRDGFLLDQDLKICDIMKDSTEWIELPDYVDSVAAEALNKLSSADGGKKPLSLIIMPGDGHTVTFEDGCFNGYTSMTLACYTDEQEQAAAALGSKYPDCSFYIMRIEKTDDGLMYMTGKDGNTVCMIPEDVYSIHNNVFKDIESDCLAVELKGYMIPVLSGFEEGTPFSFGIDDSRIKVDLSMSSCTVKDLIDNWTAPLAGYYASYSLKEAIKKELGENASELDVYNELIARLLAAENRVRAMLGMEPATGPDDMIFDTPERPADPEPPADQGKTDIITEPAVPKNDAPTDIDVTEGVEKSTEQEEPENDKDAASSGPTQDISDSSEGAQKDAAKAPPSGSAGVKNADKETEEVAG